MGKASRKKHLKRQQAVNLEKYSGVKLSEALIDICEPYDYDDLSLDAYKKLMTMAALAWNIANQPTDSRHEALLGFIKTMPEFKEELETDVNQFMVNEDPKAEPPTSIVMLQLVSVLIQRKDELYPNDDRVVMDFKVTETPTDRHLSVSSIIPASSRQ
jgi:hypothetical protein